MLIRTGAGTGNNKGKGKGAARDEPEEVPDSEEDVGQPVAREQLAGKYKEKESTPDPIDCIQSDEARPRSPKQHAFERLSPKPNDRRIPPDGPATAHLRTRIRDRESKVVDVDAPSEEDEIQPAVFSDVDDGPPHDKVAATPNGRLRIPKGAVANKIPMFEQQQGPSPPRPPKPQKNAIRTIDFTQPSVKQAMKPKGGKVGSFADTKTSRIHS